MRIFAATVALAALLGFVSSEELRNLNCLFGCFFARRRYGKYKARKWPKYGTLEEFPISDFAHEVKEELGDELRVHIATWNVNSNKPPENIDALLGIDTKPEERKPDLIVVGLQEMSATLRKYISNLIIANKWTNAIGKKLTEHEYFEVKSLTMFGVALYVYALIRHEYALDVTNIDAVKVPTGFGGHFGNKGGVIVNFKWFDADFSIINSHLPAHDEGYAKRIEDFKTIESRRKSSCQRPSDFLFWLGDLNFRVSDVQNLDANRIQHMIFKGQKDELLEKDQLKQAQSEGSAFVGWEEQEINFKPTFKLVTLTNTYNLKRRPSWTDRILYKSETNRIIKPLLYDSLNNYLTSDHRPVIAEFYITLDTERF